VPALGWSGPTSPRVYSSTCSSSWMDSDAMCHGSSWWGKAVGARDHFRPADAPILYTPQRCLCG
jgi:hypothetical protein